MPPKKESPRGFTLIELLVSLVLLSVVLVLVYGGFSQISEGARRQTFDLTEGQELRLLLRLVADDLQSAQWLEYYEKKTDVDVSTGIVADTVFEQGKDFSSLNFHTATATRFFRELPPETDPGLHEVGYTVRKEEEGDRLNLERREDFYIDSDLEHGGRTTVLAEGIEDFLVEFLPPGSDTAGLEEPWQKRWDSNTQPENMRMPQAIQLTISRRDGAGKIHKAVLAINLGQAFSP